MQTINIAIQGDEPQLVTLSLDEVQVTNLYLNNKAQIKQIADLEKKLSDTESSLKYASNARDEAKDQIKLCRFHNPRLLYPLLYSYCNHH